MRPFLPAASHGQYARAWGGAATWRGSDQCLPKSCDTDHSTTFGLGVSAPPQPPFVPFWRGSVSQTMYTLCAESTAIAGQWANIVPTSTQTGLLKLFWPRCQIAAP